MSRLTKTDLTTLQALAAEGRVIARVVGYAQADTLPEWTKNEFDLARALLALTHKPVNGRK